MAGRRMRGDEYLTFGALYFYPVTMYAKTSAGCV